MCNVEDPNGFWPDRLSYSNSVFNSVGTFPAEGYPSIDSGREHLEFLRKIYLRCEPWKKQALMLLKY